MSGRKWDGFHAFHKGISAKVNALDEVGIWTQVVTSTFRAGNCCTTRTSNQVYNNDNPSYKKKITTFKGHLWWIFNLEVVIKSNIKTKKRQVKNW